tara:strand:- start:207 stop:596 length:390 start_codon:yes stop_codon:yes gene_type:complete
MPVCQECHKSIIGNSWMSFKRNTCIHHICSYRCSNKYGLVGFENIINKEDFTKYPIPYVYLKKVKEDDMFYVLTNNEIYNLSNFEKNLYYSKFNLEIEKNPNLIQNQIDYIKEIENDGYDSDISSDDSL